MLKYMVLLYLVQGLMASMRSKEDVDAMRKFLYNTQKPLTKPLEEMMAEHPKSKAWEVSGKFEGDIVLTEKDIETMVQDYATNFTNVNTRNAMTDLNRRWRGGVVYYDTDPRYTQEQRNHIDWVASLFYERTCVRWVRRTNQVDYVYISANPEHGCSAQVGWVHNQGRHWLNLAPPGCLHWTIVFHEMGHTVGFYHMHQTPVRYGYVWIAWQNMRETDHWHLHIWPYMNMQDLPYEYASNQHYGPYTFTTNGQRTIVARFNDNGLMGQGQFITGVDIWRIARLYRCPGAWSVEVRPEDLNKPYDQSFNLRMKQAAAKELATKIMDEDTIINEESYDADTINEA